MIIFDRRLPQEHLYQHDAGQNYGLPVAGVAITPELLNFIKSLRDNGDILTLFIQRTQEDTILKLQQSF